MRESSETLMKLQKPLLGEDIEEKPTEQIVEIEKTIQAEGETVRVEALLKLRRRLSRLRKRPSRSRKRLSRRRYDTKTC